MNVLINTNQLIEEVNNYNVNLNINNQKINMLIKKSDSLQNLYDKVRYEYMKNKIKTVDPDHIIQNEEYWFTDIIDTIFIYNKEIDNKFVIPENNNILVNDYINEINNKPRIGWTEEVEPNNLTTNVINYFNNLFN
tara:strand:+ start:2658 stop:3065 length:408 start_codon:yes stop_codon:yes gene_type:complete